VTKQLSDIANLDGLGAAASTKRPAVRLFDYTSFASDLKPVIAKAGSNLQLSTFEDAWNAFTKVSKSRAKDTVPVFSSFVDKYKFTMDESNIKDRIALTLLREYFTTKDPANETRAFFGACMVSIAMEYHPSLYDSVKLSIGDTVAKYEFAGTEIDSGDNSIGDSTDALVAAQSEVPDDLSEFVQAAQIGLKAVQ
jgi:hypothetical protein